MTEDVADRLVRLPLYFQLRDDEQARVIDGLEACSRWRSMTRLDRTSDYAHAHSDYRRAGFIGGHLAEALLDAGHQVFVLDDLSTGSIDNIAHLKGRRGLSLHHRHGLQRRASSPSSSIAPTSIFHLAAAVGVKLIVQDPVHTIETNVHGTEVVLRHAAKKQKLVFIASTSEVYGKSTDVPFREDADLVMGATSRHRWAYACSKALDEFLALAYWKQKQLPVIVVRFFNTVGPRQTSRYGMVLPTFVRQALTGEPITVFGDGTQSRSFTYVGDVIGALLKLMNEPQGDRPGAQHRQPAGSHDSRAGRADQARDRVARRRSSPFRTIRPTTPGFEDMPRRVPDLDEDPRADRLRAEGRARRDHPEVIAEAREYREVVGHLR